MNPLENKEFRQVEIVNEKAQQILEGALQEFLVHGYAATSMDRVAATAGVSKATVYSHFGDKEGLFIALVKRLAQKKYQTIVELHNPELMKAKPQVVLRQVAAKLLDTTNDQEYLSFVRLIIGESGRFPQLAQTFVKNLGKPGIEVLAQYLGSNPQLKISDPVATARVMIGALVHYVLMQEILSGEEIVPMERDRLINTLVDLIAPPKA